MSAANFWWLVTIACLVWYSTITVYVSVRGITDIRNMFRRLKNLDPGESSDEAGPG
jgi:hypothetical protein